MSAFGDIDFPTTELVREMRPGSARIFRGNHGDTRQQLASLLSCLTGRVDGRFSQKRLILVDPETAESICVILLTRFH